MTYLPSQRRRDYRRTIRVPAIPYQRKSIAEIVLQVLGYMTLGLMFYAMLMLIVVNIITGCGQAEYFADGTWQTGTCHPMWLFPESKQSVRGTW